MRVHRTVNIGFLRKFKVSPRYPRLLLSSEKAGTSPAPAQVVRAAERGERWASGTRTHTQSKR
ncbi:hypothetical protein CSUI_008178 [Cystoisospora suis]|uniref:Uncharacterized protein n=1 Tax=Cystoisospora suis TaxID=483139 RepID=A0A2C6KNN5_9APIC|nr:hypothetical protein CSUI_008178 [Cystoisospora suis]